VRSSLADYAGQRVRVRWRATNDAFLEEAGMYLDDIRVTPSQAPTQCQVLGTLLRDGFE
jgi:hypothetical protein